LLVEDDGDRAGIDDHRRVLAVRVGGQDAQGVRDPEVLPLVAAGDGPQLGQE
jgi:hypothetical protein